jgi:hypothetical protein
MTDITHLDRGSLPSSAQLLKATAVAIVVAAIILVAAILPAEYGIDPTGIGRRLGLTSLSAGPAAASKLQSAAPGGLDDSLSLTGMGAVSPVWRAPTPYRTDELSLTLQPNEGAEIKASMTDGERFVFTWAAEGGTVSFDMHGEKHDSATGEFQSYWKGGKATGGHGEFQAPFAGTHGWYWHNGGDRPVVIRVQTSGFYEKLYRPETSKAPPTTSG